MASETLAILLQRLRELRRRHGLSQEAFAERTGMSYKYYQAVEAGRKRNLRLSTLEKLAEDKVAARLMNEMLAGQRSLGNDYGVVTRIERQANDWEPFSDIVVTAPTDSGESCKIGGSVKSNRQISAHGARFSK